VTSFNNLYDSLECVFPPVWCEDKLVYNKKQHHSRVRVRERVPFQKKSTCPSLFGFDDNEVRVVTASKAGR